MDNRLYYGDNLEILRNREYFPDECVDLIYLDPPFNSNRDHNVLFKSESGTDSEAQITAFEDTWHWGETAEQTYRDLIIGAPAKVSMAIEALLNLIDRNQMMAYLVMMAARLVELDRVLKPTGSLYLHCDPTASHYLKILLDAIFDPRNFKNELIWKRTSAHSDARRYGRVHDVILYYSKSDEYVWNEVHTDYDEAYLKRFRHQDDDGRRWTDGDLSAKGLSGGGYTYTYKGVNSLWRVPLESMKQLDEENRLYFTSAGGIRIKRYLDELPGRPLQDVFTDIAPINSQAKERLGYPTQKPVALMERIISVSSQEGDLVLDPFCGCGTTCVGAHKLKRRWIGIDITHLGIALQKHRLQDTFELASGRDYAVIGEPRTIEGARELARDSANEGRYQFEWWALSLVGAKPIGGRAGSRKGKKGADKGIDGIINFFEQNDKGKAKARTVVVQVKSGVVSVKDIRELKSVVESEKAAIGLLITLEPPTQNIIKEALEAGYYESDFWQSRYRRLQIMTIGDLLGGAPFDMPPQHGTHQKAQRYTPTGKDSSGKSQQGLL